MGCSDHVWFQLTAQLEWGPQVWAHLVCWPGGCSRALACDSHPRWLGQAASPPTMLAEGREPVLLEGVPGESRPKAEGGLTPLNPLGPLHGPQLGFLL